MSLAQGHDTVTPVRLKHAAPQSRVKHSTTEPPSEVVTFPDHHSLAFTCMYSAFPL